MDITTDATLDPDVDLEIDEAAPIGTAVAERRLQGLWLALTARAWRSLVVVPACPLAPAAEVARGLAEVGARMGEPAAAVVADALGYESALALAERARRASAGPDRVVLAIPAVVTEPLGVAVTRAADLVVVAVERGRTRLADVERTVELVGRDKIAGCVLS